MERIEFKNTFKQGEAYHVRLAPITAWTSKANGHATVTDALGYTIDGHVLAAILAGSAVIAQVVFADDDEVSLQYRFGETTPTIVVNAARVAEATIVRKIDFGSSGDRLSVWLSHDGALVSGERLLDRGELRQLADELAAHLRLETHDAVSATPQPQSVSAQAVGDEVEWDELEVGCLYFDRGTTAGAPYGACLREGVSWLYHDRDRDLDHFGAWLSDYDGLASSADSNKARVLAVGLQTLEDVRRAIAAHRGV